MTTYSRLSKMFALVLFMALVAWPLAGMAGDTDPGGEALKALHQQKDFKAKIAGSSGGWTTVCMAEVGTGIGEMIWGERMKKDKCPQARKCDQPGPEGTVACTVDYCYVYSMHCPHYSWSAGCLKNRTNCEF